MGSKGLGWIVIFSFFGDNGVVQPLFDMRPGPSSFLPPDFLIVGYEVRASSVVGARCFFFCFLFFFFSLLLLLPFGVISARLLRSEL